VPDLPPVLCCLQCSLKALLDGREAPIFDETPDAHMTRCHPDPEVTSQERHELERRLQQRSDQAHRN
jgi:hypothetical protein